MLAHIVVPVVDAFDFRPSSNGCGDCARGRAQSKRVWESDGATAQTVQFADLGSPVTRMLAHMLARAVDGTDFRASRSGGGSEAAAAHSRRECGRAMARRRRLSSLPTFGSPVTRMLAHMLARAVDGTDFRASRSGGRSEAAAAHSRRECGRAMARRRRQCSLPTFGSPVTRMLAHMLARPIWDFRHLRTAIVGRRVNAIVTRVGAGPIC